MSKENLSEQELAQKLQEAQKKKQDEFNVEYQELIKKFGIGIALTPCPNCEGRGYVMQFLPVQEQK